jgi:hypothetical protein
MSEGTFENCKRQVPLGKRDLLLVPPAVSDRFMNPIQSVLVVGAGSAGLMSAMALKRAFPDLEVTILHSVDKPVIGVGESTTVVFPPFLHGSLGLNLQEFFREVRPSWKLGIRFVWGDPSDEYFNYPFDSCMVTRPPALRKMPPYYCQHDWSDASRCWALMDRGLSPCIPSQDGSVALKDAFGYHIDNERFIRYLTVKSAALGIHFVEGRLLSETDGRLIPELLTLANARYRVLWDEVRDFLAVHYRFNRRSDSEFWRHCRANTDLAGAAEMVDVYRRAGPSILCETVLPGAFLFGYDGFMALLVGQRVETQFRYELSDDDLRRWDAYRDDIRQAISVAVPMHEALRQMDAT